MSMPIKASAGHVLARLGLIATGLVGSAFCGRVIYNTAQTPLGDGSGMQWVVLGPLAMLFFGLILPALMLGIRGWPTHRAGDLPRRRTGSLIRSDQDPAAGVAQEAAPSLGVLFPPLARAQADKTEMIGTSIIVIVTLVCFGIPLLLSLAE
jgi:hypothetical protein